MSLAVARMATVNTCWRKRQCGSFVDYSSQNNFMNFEKPLGYEKLLKSSCSLRLPMDVIHSQHLILIQEIPCLPPFLCLCWFLRKWGVLDWQDGSVGEDSCCQAWQPEFNPGTHMWKERTDSTSCSPTLTNVHHYIGLPLCLCQSLSLSLSLK